MPGPEYIMVHPAAPGFAYAVKAVVGLFIPISCTWLPIVISRATGVHSRARQYRPKSFEVITVNAPACVDPQHVPRPLSTNAVVSPIFSPTRHPIHPSTVMPMKMQSLFIF